MGKEVIKKLPAGHKKSWRVKINGELIDVDLVEIEHPDFGKIMYGLRPEGYDGYIIQQPGGGGSVIVPFALINEKLYIGLILQDRVCMGGKVWNIPRGYIDPGENHLATAIRETIEETGFDPTKRIFQINSKPMNSDNSMFMTDQPNEGVQYFGFQIHENEIESLSTYAEPLKFKPGIIKPLTPSGERIYSCQFWRYDFAIGLRDQFSVVGAVKLKYHLQQKAKAENYGYC